MLIMNSERKKAILHALERAWKDGRIGLNVLELSEETGISRITIAKYVERLKAEGKIKERNCGKGIKLYVLSRYYKF